MDLTGGGTGNLSPILYLGTLCPAGLLLESPLNQPGHPGGDPLLTQKQADIFLLLITESHRCLPALSGLRVQGTLHLQLRRQAAGSPSVCYVCWV